MSNMLSFSEDMLPRHFPKVHRSKSSQQLDKVAIVIPQPTLPSVSLICSNEIGVKAHPTRRKSSDRQYHTILQNDSMKTQVKPVKKHVRFVAHNGDINQSKLECTFLQSQPKHPLYQSRRIQSEVTDNIKRTPIETNRLTSDVSRANCLSWSRSLPQLHENDSSKINYLQADNVAIGPREKDNEQRSQSHSSYEILLNILEEQQRHISMQRNQILMQEKQNLEQQKEICILEYQIQKLLLQKETVVVQGYEPPNMTNVFPTKDNLPSTPPIDFGRKISGFSENINNDKVSKDLGLISRVTNVELSSFVFDGTCGDAESAIFYNKIQETVSSNPHSSACADSTPCSSYGQSQLAVDRSLVLSMLRMKYKCSEVDAQRFSDKEIQLSYDVPFDVYDYLVRHGLIKHQI